MAVTAASLRIAHPEFTSAPDAVVNAAIASAAACHDSEVWGTLLDSGVELKACDTLARSPYGRDMRLTKDVMSTVYLEEWKRLRTQVGVAWRVIP